MILYFDEIKLKADKHGMPKFSTHLGRKWVSAYIYVDGKKIKSHFDGNFGNCLYFEYKNNSYRIYMKGSYYHTIAGVVEYSINPLKEIVEFTTSNPNSN